MINTIDNSTIQNIDVKYSEMDHNFALKPYSLLNFLQDIASENAEKHGFGYSYIVKKNYAWFLIKYRMEFNDYPVGVYELTLKTKPRGYNKLFAYREFELSHNDNILGKVFSMWTLVDIQSRNPVLIGNAIPESPNMQPYQKQETDLSFAKIKLNSEPSIIKEFEVRYNDLDVNGHANNGNYIVWAFEPLSFDFKANNKIKTIDMMFKKEAKCGEKLIVEVGFNDDKTTVHIIKNMHGDEICLVQCVWA